MATKVIMPKLGLIMKEGTVAVWLKKEGDRVTKGEGLLEIMTEKVTYEVESSQDGVLLKILARENEVRPVGQILGVVGEKDEDISHLLSKAELREEKKKKGEAIKVVKEEKILALTGIRKLTAERMSESFRTVPHFSVSINVDMENVLDFMKELAPRVQRDFPAPLSLTAVIIAGASRALKDHPMVNSKFAQGTIELIEDVNICVAVATDEGLVAPVIHRTDTLSLGEIAKNLEMLADKARNTKLSLEDLSGGTFTISNLGMFGVESFNPIINPPQAAILAVGAMKETPVVRGGKIVIAPTVGLTLVADHRVLDGVMVAGFLQSIKHLLEAPTILNQEQK